MCWIWTFGISIDLMFRPKVGSAKKIWEPHPPTHVLMLAVQHCISTQLGGFGDISGLAFILAYLFLQWIFCSGHFWFPSVVWRTHTDAWIVVTSLKSLLSELVFHFMSQLCICGIYVFTVLRTCPLKPQLSVEILNLKWTEERICDQKGREKRNVNLWEDLWAKREGEEKCKLMRGSVSKKGGRREM